MSFGGVCKHSPFFVARIILAAVIRNAHFCSWTQVPVLAVVEWVQGGSLLSSSQITSNVFKGSISEFAAAEEDALDALDALVVAVVIREF